MDIKNELSRVSELIEAELKSCFKRTDSDFSVLHDAELYSLLAGGKRIRPFLVLRTCTLFGGTEQNALPLALALEMIHTYSLIHDDLPCMDNDTLRRGKPTCHVQFGEDYALLAGDALLTRAFETVAGAESLSATLRIDAIRTLSAAAGDFGMLAGQVMDSIGEKIPHSEDKLFKMHSLKTGALIKAACRLGMIAAGIPADDPRSRAAEIYAENIGLAFQVIDDVLDRTGDAASFGKPIGSDSKNGKTTFLSFLSVEDAERYAVELTDRAITAISDYDRDGSLTALAYYLCNRTY